jgi:hypothetical protein
MHVSVVRPFVVFAVGFALVGAALTPLRAEAPAEPAPQSAAAGPLIQLAQDARSPWERCHRQCIDHRLSICHIVYHGWKIAGCSCHRSSNFC